MDNDDNPLLKALPPETDYLSYLTILEYNLSKEQLSTLHNILQDTNLTANIGWDLVHLLLPLLPDSQLCLQDVARLGNPREVVLKVTELLEELAKEDDEQDEELLDNQPEDEERLSGKVDDRAADGKDALSTATAPRSGPPSRELRFTVMLDMLSILHPRIKTKHPSRFLSTSLQAILSAYGSLSVSLSATESVLSFVKRLSGTKRPALPPRKSSSAVLMQTNGHSQGSAPDPEANEDGLAPGETELHTRLLQSFLTFVAEVYLSSAPDQGQDAPGMNWATRYQEVMHPDKCVPGRQRTCELYAEVEVYHERDATMGQILALARDLSMKPDDLINLLVGNSENGLDEEASDLPSSPSDVPLSQTGALYILSEMVACPIFFQPAVSAPFPADILPDYIGVIISFISDPAMGGIGMENESLLDALFFLGFYTLHSRPRVTPPNDDEFNNALQRLSMLSARLPSPILRYHAHRLASTLLHLHPSEDVKLAYIKDTLEHCPYENLKSSAVGWLKDEILAAHNGEEGSAGHGRVSMFATPVVLEILEPYLWPEVRKPSKTEKDYETFQSWQVFYLSVLNLLYLLITNTMIAGNLQISRFIPTLTTSFLDPLVEGARYFEAALGAEDPNVHDQEEVDLRVAEMRLLLMNCGHVLERIKHT